uniref:NADH dehydrogenase subunit 6 n=1 Tax=Helix pomatia TaxID=6536 RepID=A0A481ZPR8_HELPO|nr:NADH dehydrogenase subunit 6 [Helix pomatia]
MYLITCSIMVLLLTFLLSLLLTLSSPLALTLLFFFVVVFNTFNMFLLSSDFFPYMLYLVYVGGLLVLMVYMVIISTNYRFASMSYSRFSMMSILSLFLMMFLYLNTHFTILLFSKNLLSVGSFELHNSALVILVLFLLYTFMYICESVRLGGRALSVGKNLY